MSDIWSLGITLVEVVTGRFPIPGDGSSPLSSVLDVLKYIEEEPAPRLPAGEFSKDFEHFTQSWYTLVSPDSMDGIAWRRTQICVQLPLHWWSSLIGVFID